MTSIQDVSPDPEAAGKRVEEFSEPGRRPGQDERALVA
jgi:hypothetical protein